MVIPIEEATRRRYTSALTPTKLRRVIVTRPNAEPTIDEALARI